MRKRIPWILATLVVLGMAAGWYADHVLKRHGHPGLRTFLHQWWTNYPKSFQAEPPVVSITVDEEGLQQLESVVDRALEAGVIEREGNDYVDGAFQVTMPGDGAGSGEFKGKLRIKGKMTDHVEGRKWSFRVVAKKSGGFLGMKRFSLQHPGTRNYLCDWLFHRLMQGEGIIALRYGFCKVRLNDEDLGVYAYEEHFGPELLEHNGRLPGPIVRFDPGLFWLHRTQGLDGGAKVNDAYGAYQAANLDAFGSDDLATDAEQGRYYEQAIALVNGFRRGDLPAGAVFDADRTGRRLAMLDLVGGHHSMDWSDVKFYFDPVAQRLEPISYESFSAYPTKELAGAYRATGPFREEDELHTALLKEPAIMAAYVHHLERYSRKEWLDSAFTALHGALDTASATLYGEFPYKPLDRDIYYANQRAIRTLLATPKGFHAYADHGKGDTLRIACVPIESLPMQVDSLVRASGRKVVPLHPTVLPCRARGRTAAPVQVVFPVVNDSAVRVVYHILGASEHRTVDVFPFALSASSAQDELLAYQRPNAAEFPFIAIDEPGRTITLKPGSWRVERSLIIPAGYRCVAAAPLKLDLVNGAELISYSPLYWTGLEDAPIEVFSTDSTSRGVHVIDAAAGSTLHRVEFRHLTRYAYDQPRSGDVSFHASPVAITNCWFRGTGSTLLDISIGDARISDCAFGGGSDQLETHFANVQLAQVVFGDAHDDALSAEGGLVNAKAVEVRSARGIAIKAIKGARVQAEEVQVLRSGTGFEGREGARLQVTGLRLDAVERVAEAKKEELRYGPVKIDLTKVQGDVDPARFKCASGSTIRVDGKKVGEGKAVKGT